MALTEDQYKQQVILQVGDNADGLLAANIDTIWLAHDDRADMATQFLYAKRDAIDMMLADVRRSVDFKALDGSSVSLSDLFKHLNDMRDDAETQIAIAVATAQAAAGGAAGQLTTTAPVAPPANMPDASSGLYRGSPYAPPRRRWP